MNYNENLLRTVIIHSKYFHIDRMKDFLVNHPWIKQWFQLISLYVYDISKLLMFRIIIMKFPNNCQDTAFPTLFSTVWRINWRINNIYSPYEVMYKRNSYLEIFYYFVLWNCCMIQYHFQRTICWRLSNIIKFPYYCYFSDQIFGISQNTSIMSFFLCEFEIIVQKRRDWEMSSCSNI